MRYNSGMETLPPPIQPSEFGARLAAQLERLLTDDALVAELRANARGLAELFSVARMTDAVLAHMNLPPRP